MDLRVRVSALDLLRCEFSDFERSLESCNRYSERIDSHKLTLMANISTGVSWNFNIVLLNAIHMLLSLALGTFD